MTADELKSVVDEHAKWLKKEIGKRADLQRANLQDANLQCADLRGANLQDANLQDANFQDADLQRANLQGAKLPHFQIPEGALIVWKKVAGKLVKLLIPVEAKRTASLVGRKCRAEYAKVLSVEGEGAAETRGVTYRAGETVLPDNYDDDPRVECAHGIHFFLTRAEAEEWT